MRAKICGITHADDALLAIQEGAWALGFNFYKKSPRYIETSAAQKIMRNLPESTIKVGLVVDKLATECEDLLLEGGLSLLQVYAPMEVPCALKSRMILCLHANHLDDLPESSILQQYGYLLLDAPKQKDGLLGGTGTLCNWEVAAYLAKKYRLILAGGLTKDNVHNAIQTVKPFAVDVASGVQSTPGRLDKERLHDFLQETAHDQ